MMLARPVAVGGRSERQKPNPGDDHDANHEDRDLDNIVSRQSAIDRA
jgi:hypothetical protein